MLLLLKVILYYLSRLQRGSNKCKLEHSSDKPNIFPFANVLFHFSNEFLVKEEALTKLQHGETEGDHIALINATCILFNYISDIVTALSPAAVGRATSPPWDTELLPSTLDLNADWPEELCGREDDDGDSTGDDSVS